MNLKSKTKNNFQFDDTKLFASVSPEDKIKRILRTYRRQSASHSYQISKRLRPGHRGRPANSIKKMEPQSESEECNARTCNICMISYRCHKDWKEHAIQFHILKKNPTPRVEMNYVKLPKAENLNEKPLPEAIITSGSVKVQERLKLTFCKEKGSYFVRNTSLPNEEFPVALQNNISSSPQSVINEEGSGEGDKLSSCSSDKENNPTPSCQSASLNRAGKVPTSGTVVYLGSGASESEKALANSNNSHMVIIQNDILRIGSDADAENIQRITDATTVVKTGINKVGDKVTTDSMPPYAKPRDDEVITSAMVSEVIPNSTPELCDKPEVEQSMTNEDSRSIAKEIQTPEKTKSAPPIAIASSPNLNPTIPFHITLPCGIEIQQLPFPTPPTSIGEETRESNDTTGNTETINEVVTGDVNHEEDFRCKVCNAQFTSDEDLETHFSESHFRGIANNILEEQPESPWVEPPAAHASSQSQSSIFDVPLRPTSVEEPPQNFSVPRQPLPELMHMLDRRNSNPELHLRCPNPPMPNIPGPPPRYRLPPTSTVGHVRNYNLHPNQAGNMPPLPIQNGYPVIIPRTIQVSMQQPQFQRGPVQIAPRPSAYTSLHTNSGGGVIQQQPRQIHVAVNPNQIPNGTRISDVTSVEQLVPRSQPQQSQSQNLIPTQQQHHQQQQQHRNHIIAMAQQHRQQQQQYQNLQQQSLRTLQEQQMRELVQTTSNAVTNEIHRQALLEQQRKNAAQTNTNQQSQIFHRYPSPLQQQLQGRRLSSSVEISSAPKQPRLDGQQHVIQGMFPNNPSQLSPTGSIASALNGGIRLGSSVTLSLCPGDENNNRRQSPTLTRNGTGQTSSPILNANPNVASALAVRGVMVTPASPPASDHLNIPTHRLTSQLTISNNPVEFPNSTSVIQNGSSPTQQHVFAIPSNPPPRANNNVLLQQQTTERPERPPTVDLTNDDGTQINNISGAGPTRYIERGAPTGQLHRAPLGRPANCSLCGVLFCSLASLEEHKITRHGIGTSRNQAPRVQYGPPPRPRGPPPQFQSNAPPRPANNVLRAPQQSQSAPSLFIPLIDMSRMDATKLKRLEDVGVISMIPLQLNERTLGQIGIPLVMTSLPGQRQGQVPWDQVQPLGPAYSPSQLWQNFSNRQNSANQ